MEIKEIIKNNRKKYGLTMKQVAEYVGVSEATVSRWESGAIKNMTREKIALLSEILHISPSVITGWEDVPAIMDNKDDNMELKFALFGGADGITDEMLEEVMHFARFVEQRERDKNK